MTELTVDATKIAETMRHKASRLMEVSEFLGALIGKEPGATEMFSRVVGIRSFIETEAEEIETGLCCCRHLSEEEMKSLLPGACARCGGSGISEFVTKANGESVQRKRTNERDD